MVLAVVSSSPLTVGFSTNNKHSFSVSCLHKALRDHQWEEIVENLMKQPYLIFQVNARGWNALHVAASSRPYGSWWKWLLQQAVKEKSADFQATNDTGQTVLDLYFRYTLYPLPWQRHSLQEQANYLRQALNSMIENNSLLEQVRNGLRNGTDTYRMVVVNENNSQSISEVDRICIFWINLYLLVEAVHSGSIGTVPLESLPVVHFLAAAHWCPHLVSRSAARLFPNQFRQEPLPLHIWCQTPKIQQSLGLSHEYSISAEPPHDMSMLTVLCQEYPEGASRRIGSEFPLSCAVRHGKSWNELVSLFEAYPSALFGNTTIFCLPALSPLSDTDAEWTAKRQDPQRLSIWCYLSKGDKLRAIQYAREQLELQQVDTIFELLRRNPAAIALQR